MRLFDGQRAWVVQRISALLLLVLAVLALPFASPLDFSAWRAFAGGVLGGPLIALLFGALGVHAWVGLRGDVRIGQAAGHQAQRRPAAQGQRGQQQRKQAATPT